MTDQNEKAFVDWLRAAVADPTNADDFHVVSQELLVRLDATKAILKVVLEEARLTADGYLIPHAVFMSAWESVT